MHERQKRSRMENLAQPQVDEQEAQRPSGQQDGDVLRASLTG